MKKNTLAFLFAMTIALAAIAWAGDDPMVGGAAMYPSKNIVQNAVNSQDHTTLVAAVKAAGTGRGSRRSGTVHRLRAHQ